MRNLLAFIFASLLFIPQLAVADTCPDIKQVVRTPGEYSWFSNVSGWEGGFYYPFPGSGHSTHISHFIEAQWVQVTNIENGLGYIVCSYKGNYDDEVVRMVQIREDVTKRPKNINWSCQIKPDYPSTACTCTGLVGQCPF